MNELTASPDHPDSGASAVEYGLLVVAVAAAIAIAVFLLGDVVETAFSQSCAVIQSEAQTSTTC